MKVTRVQYTVQPGFAEQNKENIAAVMGELRALNEAGFKYASYVLADGKTFMHLVHHQGQETAHLPGSLDSFKHFQAELTGHLEVPPNVEQFDLVQSSFEIF